MWKDNWLTYRGNLINNPLAKDRLRYDVLFHTDLSRERGDSVIGLPLDRINWGNYDPTCRMYTTGLTNIPRICSPP